jgi:hypothetical protein
LKTKLVLPFLLWAANSLVAQRIKLLENASNHSIDVIIDNKLFTSYFDPGQEVLKKPVLFPIKTALGTTITRGWPIDPRPNERTDHPHHVGLWLNYESVNGFDFWNNSSAIPLERRLQKYGSIKPVEILEMKSGGSKGILRYKADWISADGSGEMLLDETTTYVFSGKGKQRIIDRITQLRAEKAVTFKDVKDGLLALRVAHELELPSKTPEKYTDTNGIETAVPVLNNQGVTGSYLSSEGIKDDKVWSTKGRWMQLSGTINTEPITVAIIDHPKNPGYPSYWHARGYGLFAVNPLGANVFSNGKEALNLSLKEGETITFRYRIVINSYATETTEIEKLAKKFANEIK